MAANYSMLFVVGALLVLSSIFLYEKIVHFDRCKLSPQADFSIFNDWMKIPNYFL
jgi:hypothetical protein